MRLQDDGIVLKFSAAAVLIYLGESMIPKPFPWFRIGLANILILIALLRYGFRAGISVATAKVLVGAMLTGSFLTPFFFFTLLGTFASLLVMHLLTMLPFSIIGISVAGSVTHNLVQMLLGVFLFLPLTSIRLLYPILSTLGIGTGLLTGIIGLKTMRLLYDASG